MGPAQNTKSPSFTSLGSNPASNDMSNLFIGPINGQITSQVPYLNGSNGQLLSNGSSTTRNCSSGHNRLGQMEATATNGSRTKEAR